MYINTTKNDQKGRPKSTKADMESSKTSSSWMVAMVALSACHSSPARGKKTADATLTWGMVHHPTHMAMCQNLVPLVNIKIAGKWMFIPLKMVLIGIDPYPYPLKILKGILGRVYGYGFPHLNLESRKIATCPYYLSSKNAEITDWPIPVTFTGPIWASMMLPKTPAAVTAAPAPGPLQCQTEKRLQLDQLWQKIRCGEPWITKGLGVYHLHEKADRTQIPILWVWKGDTTNGIFGKMMKI